ncbi:ABC transporter permease [Mammaliicoccus sciuri]|uniref:ABC transporter permease n=1 Tax=Mammaliicoccus sciuri TaxID=1296 RepID=UPI0021CECCF7|nr:ABC transporter permease [Mammaliicoccus sciuri]UXV33367.1 ABC transporter permease [Mammaliicoccus sciuri]
MKTLLKNELLSYIREPFALFFSIVLPIVLVFIYGDAYGKYDYNKVLSGYDMSVLFNIVFLVGNIGLMGLTMTIIEKRTTFSSKRDQILPINDRGFQV